MLVSAFVIALALDAASARERDASPTRARKMISVQRLLDVVETRDREIDLNEDGTPDLVREYDSAGRLKRLELDSNFDGRIDFRMTKADGVIHLEEDRTFDGKMDRFTTQSEPGARAYWREEEVSDRRVVERLDASGLFLARRTEKVSPTGEVALLESALAPVWRPMLLEAQRDRVRGELCRRGEVAASRAVSMLGEVMDEVNRSYSAQEGRTRFGPVVDVSDTKGSCRAREAQVRQAIERAVVRGFECLANHNNPFLARFAVYLAEWNPVVSCYEDGTEFRALSGVDPEACAVGSASARVVLGPRALGGQCGAFSLDAIVFHELLHDMGVQAGEPHAAANADDGVFACQLTCFGGGNEGQKAACFSGVKY